MCNGSGKSAKRLSGTLNIVLKSVKRSHSNGVLLNFALEKGKIFKTILYKVVESAKILPLFLFMKIIIGIFATA